MWLLYSILVLMSPLTQCQVDLSPSEKQYIPINTPTNITCHIKEGAVIDWFILFSDGSEEEINVIIDTKPSVPGITGRRVDEGFSTLVITVNTSNTSVIGLRCEGSVGSSVGAGATRVNNAINLTIYGNPDPPEELNLSNNNNSLMTSWTYHIIPTVTVMFNISLTFLSPSQLEDITVCVTDTDSHTFTLKGVRSCDPFTMCITATNTVGQSNPSCVNNSLPYIPSTDSIRYLLSREGDPYSLNLTVEVSECLQDESLFYVVLLQYRDKNQQLTSPAIPAHPESTTVITGLFRKSLYTLTIISNNSLGIGFSEPQHFCTNDVQGVTICPTMMDGVFNISCDYVSGCNYSGCSYELSSTNSYINGSIIGMNYDVVSIDVNTLYNLTVTDVNEEEVIIEPFHVNSASSCLTTTEAVTVHIIRTTEVNSNNGRIVVAVVVTVLIAALIVALLIIMLVIYLYHNDYCSNCSLLSFHKSNIKRGTDLTLEYHGSGNPHVAFEIKSSNQVDTNKIKLEESATDITYDSLTTIKNQKTIEKTSEENYSQIGTMPIYHVLEQEKISAPVQETIATKFPSTEVIPADDDAPPIPQYNPNGGHIPPIHQYNSNHDNSPSLQNATVTNSSPADIMYAEVGTRSAAKT